jgi:hypothetical protein
MRHCRHCGLKIKLHPDGSGWRHDDDNKDIITSCMLPAKRGERTPRATPIPDGAMWISNEEVHPQLVCCPLPILSALQVKAKEAVIAEEDQNMFHAIELALCPPYTLWTGEEEPV